MSPPKKATDSAAKLAKYCHAEKEAEEDNGAGSPAATSSSTEDTARVLEAISDCKSTLMGKIEEVKIDVSLIRQDLQKLRDGVTETENRISHVEDDMHPLQVTTEQLQHQFHTVLVKQDDMKNRLRRCNLRFVGLPEGSEGTDPLRFLRIFSLISSEGLNSPHLLWSKERTGWLPNLPLKGHHPGHL